MRGYRGQEGDKGKGTTLRTQGDLGAGKQKAEKGEDLPRGRRCRREGRCGRQYVVARGSVVDNYLLALVICTDAHFPWRDWRPCRMRVLVSVWHSELVILCTRKLVKGSITGMPLGGTIVSLRPRPQRRLRPKGLRGTPPGPGPQQELSTQLYG